MKAHDITVTLRVSTALSEKQAALLIEHSLCDTKYAESTDNQRTKTIHIVGVDAGQSPCMLAAEPYECLGEFYPPIVGWQRGVQS